MEFEWPPEILGLRKEPQTPPCNFLECMVVDIKQDMYNKLPRVVLYCKNDYGDTFCFQVTGFYPYMYTDYIPGTSLEDCQKIMQRELLSANPKAGNIHVEFCERQNIYGFSSGSQTFLKITLENPRDASTLKGLVQERGVRLEHNATHGKRPFRTTFDFCSQAFESNVAAPQRFMVDSKIGGFGWFRVMTSVLSKPTHIISTCMHEYAVDAKFLEPLDRVDIPPLLAMYCDIETVAGKIGKFPNPTNLNDPVVSISYYIVNLKTRETNNFVLCNAASKKSDTCTILEFPDERSLLMNHTAMIKAVDPDFFIGYNVLNFDIMYLITRLEKYFPHAPWQHPKVGNFLPLLWGREKNCVAELYHKELENGALGKMDFTLVRAPGRIFYDTMVHCRRDVGMSLNSYAMSAVAEYCKVQNKDDMDHLALPYMWRGGRFDEMPTLGYPTSWQTLAQFLILEDSEEGLRVVPTPGAKDFEPGPEFDEDGVRILEKGCFLSELPETLVGPAWSMIFKYCIPKILGETMDRMEWDACPNSRRVVNNYCFQDSVTAELITGKRKYIENCIELCRLVKLDGASIQNQGQQIRIVGAILQATRNQFILPVNDPPRLSAEDKRERKRHKGYQGATVLRPFTHLFIGSIDGIVITVDFSGLYPSIIISHNLSYDTWVPPCEVEQRKKEHVRMKKAPNGHYFVKVPKTAPISEDKIEKYRERGWEVYQHEGLWFVKKPGIHGILPRVLEGLLGARKIAKNDMEDAQRVVNALKALKLAKTDPTKKNIEVLEETTEELKKVTAAASLLLLVQKGRVSEKEYCEATAQLGIYSSLAAAYNAKQMAIKVVANSVYGFTGAEVGRLPLMALSSAVTAYGRTMIELVKSLSEARCPETGLYGYDPKNQKFAKGISKYPLRVVYGDSVTGDTPCILRHHGKIEILKIQELGEFWEKWHEEKECALVDYEVWTDQGWSQIQKVIRHHVPKDKKILKISTPTGQVCVTDEHSLLNLQGQKIKAEDVRIGSGILHANLPNPQCFSFSVDPFSSGFDAAIYNSEIPSTILNASRKCREKFVEGYFLGRGFESVPKHHAAPLYFLCESVGRNYVIQENSEGFAFLQGDRHDYITDIQEIPHDGCMVYDLQTANHHFQAGVGRIIVHNTDSDFIHAIGCTSVLEGWEIGKQLAEMCTDMFWRETGNRAIKLELEKVIDRLLQMGKKKYLMRKWEMSGGVLTCKLEAKGYEGKRRDTPEFLRDILGHVAKILFPVRDGMIVDSPEAMKPPDIPAAVRYIRRFCEQLFTRKVPFDKFIITKSINRDEEEYAGTPPAHILLAQKMVERGLPAVDKGQRIAFVFVNRGKKLSEKVEDPKYALDHGLVPDVQHYFTKFLVEPLTRFFTYIVARTKSLVVPVDEYDKMAEFWRGPDLPPPLGPDPSPQLIAAHKRYEAFTDDHHKKLVKKNRKMLAQKVYRLLFAGTDRYIETPLISAQNRFFKSFAGALQQSFTKKMAEMIKESPGINHFEEFCKRAYVPPDRFKKWLQRKLYCQRSLEAAKAFVSSQPIPEPEPVTLTFRVLEKLGLPSTFSGLAEIFKNHEKLAGISEFIESWVDGTIKFKSDAAFCKSQVLIFLNGTELQDRVREVAEEHEIDMDTLCSKISSSLNISEDTTLAWLESAMENLEISQLAERFVENPTEFLEKTRQEQKRPASIFDKFGTRPPMPQKISRNKK